MRLFCWKRAILAAIFGIAPICYRLYEAYSAKGFLDHTDLIVSSFTLAMLLGILTLVGWWANQH
ncbi:MAG: hypothetical protein NTZ46_02145 [Verrucomicrobia bacterium]|nr:hypothetical protein [Verrucomicrobiota bacterium]